jgi:hypothetical protein
MVRFIKKEIKYAYSLKEVTKICVNLSLLRKLEFPEEFENNFINAVMKRSARESFDHFKKKVLRERSATTVVIEHRNVY